VGPGKDLIAVSDAGPLIHLAQIGDLQLLNVFSSVHVSDAVWTETVTAGRVDGTELTAAATIRRHTVDDAALRRFVREVGPFSLHQGETEALLLCRQLDSPLLLADDLAAREAAWRQGVRPVGSLGIVVRAYHRGRISLARAEDCIQRLCDVSSLFVAKAIVDLAIEHLRRSS
jgi:predicted nucleic acid-binding protein